MGLQALTGKKQQFQHADEVSRRGCRISQMGKIRSNVSGRGCRISRVGNYRSYMPIRHQEGTSGSHGFETPDRTCLLGVRTVLHDLTGSEHKIINAYNIRNRSELQDLTGWELQIVHAY